ncbi:MAG: chemotaxis protein CheD [Desulfuromonadales bacterium]
MSSSHRIAISEWVVAQAPDTLICYGLGSCLGIAVYDRANRSGGLAHTLLPSPPQKDTIRRPGRFVSSAIALIRNELIDRGSLAENLAAKIVGGANMFERFNQTVGTGVGMRNIAAARMTLETLDIPLLGEDVGANFGRSMEFDLATGEIRVRTVINRNDVRVI